MIVKIISEVVVEIITSHFVVEIVVHVTTLVYMVYSSVIAVLSMKRYSIFDIYDKC
jgi:hypothetical protein